MTYSGRYIPTNRDKYKGNPLKIIYRSMWERRLMDYCDEALKRLLNGEVRKLQFLMCRPVDGKIHRYFPDFYMKVKQRNGSLKKFIIEVKPKSQLRPPSKNPKRRTRRWLQRFTHTQ